MNIWFYKIGQRNPGLDRELNVKGNISRKSSLNLVFDQSVIHSYEMKRKNIQHAYTYLMHSEIFRYPQCKQMLVSINQSTNQDRRCKQLIVISKFSIRSAKTISALKRQVCLKTLYCWILRGMPISRLRTAFKTRRILHISWIRSRWKLLPKSTGYHYRERISENMFAKLSLLRV